MNATETAQETLGGRLFLELGIVPFFSPRSITG